MSLVQAVHQGVNLVVDLRMAEVLTNSTGTVTLNSMDTVLIVMVVHIRTAVQVDTNMAGHMVILA